MYARNMMTYFIGKYPVLLQSFDSEHVKSPPATQTVFTRVDKLFLLKRLFFDRSGVVILICKMFFLKLQKHNRQLMALIHMVNRSI